MKARRQLGLAAALLALAGPIWAASPPAAAEVCSHTTLSILPPPACIGSFMGGLDGSADELALLKATWGLDFEYLGRSDAVDHGPFSDNPQVAFNGSLPFDEPQSGQFVLGLVSGGKYSYYFVNTKRRVGGLGFDSLEGVATTPQGNPFSLDYAALYVSTTAPVPEPGTMLMLGAGIGALVLRRRLTMR